MLLKSRAKLLFGILAMMTVASIDTLAQQGMPPAQVEIAIATSQIMAPQIQVPGTVISKNDSRISSEVNGRVTWISEVGDRFKAGDVIARLDDRIYKAIFIQAEANVKRLQADLKLKRLALARYEELATTSSAPVSRLEEATADRDMTEQDLIIARATLDRAKDDLERTRVKAPFPGRVVERGAQLGELTGPGTILLRLVDTDHIEIRAQAPISIASFIHDGLEVLLTDNSKTITSTIRTVIPVGDEVSRMMEIRIEIERGNWVIGSAVKVSLPSDRARKVIAVPRDALILRSNSIHIFVITDENKSKRVIIRPGAASGDNIEVIGNVFDGDKVVIRGGERLQDGQNVIIKGQS